uniref:Dihydropteridine reductase n=1 Tax=Panagrellus redivivus TaxID=6233 RepID=A0A7E4VNI5_PANRE
MSRGRVLVYGGKGALGSAVLEHFKTKGFWTLNVDLTKNDSADANVVVDPTACWINQESHILKEVETLLAGEKLAAILCVAGGWADGKASNADFIKNADLMWKQSVWSSAISARVASSFLAEGGLLQLTGAAAAVEGTPGMLGYGLAKAAVHQLVQSLADPKAAGLPERSSTLAILPVTLDTPMNRKWMAKADFSSWTPLTFVADLLHSWTTDAAKRPNSGSLVKLVTTGGETTLTPQ